MTTYKEAVSFLKETLMSDDAEMVIEALTSREWKCPDHKKEVVWWAYEELVNSGTPTCEKTGIDLELI